MKKIAVYPGSFDPVTNGHLDLIERASRLFDEVYVAVIRNPDKKPLFSDLEREDMLKATVNAPNIKIESFDGLLIEYAHQKKAQVIIRGLRAVSDFDYEFQMALTNRQIAPEIETLFLMTGHQYSYLSSSLVKQIVKLKAEVKDLIPEVVQAKLKEKFKA
jgi:pantetheine-phosphate adenylyltransferase